MTAVAEMTSVAERLAMMKRAGMWSPEEAARFDALRDAQFVLVRNDGAAGERWPCKRCGLKHEFFTVMCTPKPYRGLLDGLHAYWANIGAVRDTELSPGQRDALNVLRPVFGAAPTTLGTAHPTMAAQIAVDPRDVLVGSTLLGTLEPITRARALLYAELINGRARQRLIRFS